MKKFLGVVLVLALVCMYTLPFNFVKANDIQKVNVDIKYDQTGARSMLDLINNYRSTNGSVADDNIYPYFYDYDLEKVAMQRAAEIAFNFSDTRPDGQSYKQTISEYGFNTADRSGWLYGECVVFTNQKNYTLDDILNGFCEGESNLSQVLGYNEVVGLSHIILGEKSNFWVVVFCNKTKNDTYTAPVDGTKTVSVNVNIDLVDDVKVNYISGATAVEVGETIDIPKYNATFKYLGSEYSEDFTIPSVTFNSTDSYVKADGSNMTGLSAGTGKISTQLLGETFSFDITVTGTNNQENNNQENNNQENNNQENNNQENNNQENNNQENNNQENNNQETNNQENNNQENNNQETNNQENNNPENNNQENNNQENNNQENSNQVNNNPENNNQENNNQENNNQININQENNNQENNNQENNNQENNNQVTNNPGNNNQATNNQENNGQGNNNQETNNPVTNNQENNNQATNNQTPVIQTPVSQEPASQGTTQTPVSQETASQGTSTGSEVGQVVIVPSSSDNNQASTTQTSTQTSNGSGTSTNNPDDTNANTNTTTSKDTDKKEDKVTSTSVTKLKKGDTFTSGKLKYKVTGSNKVAVVGTTSKTIKTVTIPATVTYKGVTYKVKGIGTEAFAGNTKITKVNIGNNVQTIGKKAFYGCSSLKNVIISSTVLSSVKTNSFNSIKSGAKIKVPESRLAKYTDLIKKSKIGKKTKVIAG